MLSICHEVLGGKVMERACLHSLKRSISQFSLQPAPFSLPFSSGLHTLSPGQNIMCAVLLQFSVPFIKA